MHILEKPTFSQREVTLEEMWKFIIYMGWILQVLHLLENREVVVFSSIWSGAEKAVLGIDAILTILSLDLATFLPV